MKDLLNWLLEEKRRYFMGGTLMGIAPGFGFILDVSLQWSDMALLFLVKLLGAAVLAVATGFFTALASDFQKALKAKGYYVKNIKSLFTRKKKDNGKEQETKRA